VNIAIVLIISTTLKHAEYLITLFGETWILQSYYLSQLSWNNHIQQNWFDWKWKL